jgi:hypothetical protein
VKLTAHVPTNLQGGLRNHEQGHDLVLKVQVHRDAVERRASRLGPLAGVSSDLRALPSPYLGGSTLWRAVPARPHRSFCRLLHDPSADRYLCGLQLAGRGHESAITVFRMLNVGSAKRPWSGLSWNLNTSVQDHEQASSCHSS